MSKPLLLVTGGTGQVGTGLKIANRDRFQIVAPAHAELDLSHPAAITAFIQKHPWAAIINCAAYTAVDKAEDNPAAAFAINADAPNIISRAAAASGIPLLHISTDYVFDGSKDGPYLEDDAVAPLGVYGASKQAGERAVRERQGRHIILRTAWVVSPWGHNFVKTMLRLGAERPSLGVVSDQIGSPTSAADIAETLLTLTERLLVDPNAPTGTYQFVNAGQASWYELAAFIFEEAARHGRPIPELQAIPTSAYPTPAGRPANSVLSTARIEADYGIQPRPWRDAVNEIIDTLLSSRIEIIES